MLDHFEKFAEHLENELARYEENTTNPQVAQLDQIGAAIRAAATRKHLNAYRSVLNTLPKAEPVMHSDGKAGPYYGINAGEFTDSVKHFSPARYRSTVVYIVGPRDVVDPETLAFIAAKERLESKEVIVANADWNSLPAGFTGKEWFEFRRAVARSITYTDRVVLLDGWELSNWARFEVSIANQLGIPVTPIAEFLNGGGM